MNDQTYISLTWNSAKPGTYIIYPAEDSFHAKLEGSN